MRNVNELIRDSQALAAETRRKSADLSAEISRRERVQASVTRRTGISIQPAYRNQRPESSYGLATPTSDPILERQNAAKRLEGKVVPGLYAGLAVIGLIAAYNWVSGW